MNECLFFGHILLLIGFITLAHRLGKHALMALVTFQVVLANLFVTKEITLFSLHVTPTDAYAIGSLVGLGLLQEYYGKDEAKKLSHLNFFILLFFTAMALVQILYIPSSHDRLHPAFASILSTSPRIFLSSIFCFYLTQKLDIALFGLFRRRCSLALTMAFTLIITQALDTILFSYLALYGLVHSLFHIIVVSYLIKMIAMAAMIPFTKYLKAQDVGNAV